MHCHPNILDPQEMLADDASIKIFIFDEGVIDFTAIGNEVLSPTSMKLEEKITTSEEELIPILETAPTGANDHEHHDHIDHLGNSCNDLSSDQMTYFTNVMVHDAYYHHSTEEVQISEEIENDEYRYITDALQASEEYLINESSF